MPRFKKFVYRILDLACWVGLTIYLVGVYPKDSFRAMILILIAALIFKYDLTHLSFARAWSELNDICMGKTNKPRTPAGWIVTLSAAYLVFLFIATPLVRHWSYGTWRWDLGAIQQVIWRASHGLGLTSTIILNSSAPFHFIEQQHLEPWLYPVTLLYRVAPYTETLIVIQSLALIGCAIPLFKISKRLLPQAIGPLVLVAMFWGNENLHRVNIWDVHENAFIPFFSLWAFHFFLKRKWTAVILFTLAVASFKEDAWVIAGAMGAYFLITQKKYFLAALSAAAGFAVFVTYGSIFTVQSMALSARYNYLGNDMHEAAAIIKRKPWIFLEQLFGQANLTFIRDLFLIGAGLWAAAGWALLTIAPVFFEIALSTYGPARSLNGHYIIPLTGCLFYCIVLGINKLSLHRRVRTYLKIFVTIALLLSFWPLEYSEPQNIKYMLQSESFKKRQCYDQLLTHLPAEVPVYANDPFSTRVANRAVVLKYEKTVAIDYPGAYVIFEASDPLPDHTELVANDCGYKLARRVLSF